LKIVLPSAAPSALCRVHSFTTQEKALFADLGFVSEWRICLKYEDSMRSEEQGVHCKCNSYTLWPGTRGWITHKGTPKEKRKTKEYCSVLQGWSGRGGVGYERQGVAW